MFQPGRLKQRRDGTVETTKVFNIKGEKIQTVYEGYVPGDEVKYFTWNGKDEDGRNVASGIYLYTLEINNKVYETKRLILMR